MTDLLDESETHVMNPAREHVWMILSQTTQEVQPLDLLLPSSTEQSYTNHFSRGAVCDQQVSFLLISYNEADNIFGTNLSPKYG